MKRIFRNAAFGAAAIALTAAGALAVPGEAHATDPVTLGIIGGALVGTVLGAAAESDNTTVYYAPRAYDPPPPTVLVPACYYETQRVYDPYINSYVYQKVRVCG